MDYICYWDIIDNQVNVRYWGATFLDDGRHQDISNNFIAITNDLNPGHLYKVSMDGPNVNFKILSRTHQKEEGANVSFPPDIGSCSLHIIHGDF